MNKVFLLLGSNLGDSKERLAEATKLIEEFIGTVIKCSGFYSTAAWGDTAQPDFLNQIIVINTTLKPLPLLRKILEIEKKMGRIRTVKNAARIIDIDILFFNNESVNLKDLIIPHAQIQHRRFVLIPLVEIAADMLHPTLKMTMQQLLAACTDKLNVQKI